MGSVRLMPAGQPNRQLMEGAAGRSAGQSFVSQIPDDVLARILHGSRIREVGAGQTFISSAGSPSCGVLLSGIARVYIHRSDGARVRLRRAEAGAVIGMLAMPRRQGEISAQAISPVEFVRLDVNVLVTLGRQHPALAWAIAEELDRRLMETLLQLASPPASVGQRVVSVLLDFDVDGNPAVVEATQEGLAEWVGASREAVGRELRKLSAAGLIRLSRAAIEIPSPAALRSLAAEQPATTDPG
jgi:CRP/FNR family transcriptional regulator, cyclic AMP receptor protein